MSTPPFLSSKLIYKAKKGHIYDPAKKQYNCFKPALSGRYQILDCFPCDKNGRIHPGYATSPVPIHYSALGEVVGEEEE